MELPLHICLSGPAICRPPTMHLQALLCLPPQRSCRFVIPSLGYLTLSFRDKLPLSPMFPLSPHPQEPLSPQHTSRSSSRPNCRQSTPSFHNARRKWYCSVCKDVFHGEYECERHIGNVGKQAKCLACGKTV